MNELFVLKTSEASKPWLTTNGEITCWALIMLRETELIPSFFLNIVDNPDSFKMQFIWMNWLKINLDPYEDKQHKNHRKKIRFIDLCSFSWAWSHIFHENNNSKRKTQNDK